MKKIEILPNGRKRVYTVNEEPSKTDQSFKDECDVNNIIAKFTKTGQITHLGKIQGIFADLSDVGDLHSSLTQLTQAQEAFNELPSDIRLRFGNSPIELVRFLQDPKNDEQAVQLGLKEYKTLAHPETIPQPTQKPKKQKSQSNDDDSNDDDIQDSKKTKKSSP